MPDNRWYFLLHWTARILALLTSGFVFLFFFGEGIGPRGTYSLLSTNLSFRDGSLLALTLGSAVAMLLAWIWERWAGAAGLLLGAAFLVCCVATPGMERAWLLGVMLSLPGLLYLAATSVQHVGENAAHRLDRVR